jgi:hypothetical protein
MAETNAEHGPVVFPNERFHAGVSEVRSIVDTLTMLRSGLSIEDTTGSPLSQFLPDMAPFLSVLDAAKTLKVDGKTYTADQGFDDIEKAGGVHFDVEPGTGRILSLVYTPGYDAEMNHDMGDIRVTGIGSSELVMSVGQFKPPEGFAGTRTEITVTSISGKPSDMTVHRAGDRLGGATHVLLETLGFKGIATNAGIDVTHHGMPVGTAHTDTGVGDLFMNIRLPDFKAAQSLPVPPVAVK